MTGNPLLVLTFNGLFLFLNIFRYFYLQSDKQYPLRHKPVPLSSVSSFYPFFFYLYLNVILAGVPSRVHFRRGSQGLLATSRISSGAAKLWAKKKPVKRCRLVSLSFLTFLDLCQSSLLYVGMSVILSHPWPSRLLFQSVASPSGFLFHRRVSALVSWPGREECRRRGGRYPPRRHRKPAWSRPECCCARSCHSPTSKGCKSSTGRRRAFGGEPL